MSHSNTLLPDALILYVLLLCVLRMFYPRIYP